MARGVNSNIDEMFGHTTSVVDQNSNLVEIKDYLTGLGLTIADGPNLDGFSRVRVSTPNTLYDAQQEYGLDILATWDIVANGNYGPINSTNGSVADGATLVGPTDSDSSMTPIESGSTIGDLAIMQSRQYVRYIPGKSQLILLTGIFAESTDDQASFVLRTSTSGSAAEEEIQQADWNIDPFDGTGPSGIALDFTKTNILVIDAQWLGVGRIRIGFDVDGLIMYAHEFLNANNKTAPYTQTFNLPVRMESETLTGETVFCAGYYDNNNGVFLKNTKTGQGGGFHFICCSVQSEGGEEARGFSNAIRNSAQRSINSATPVLAIRPKTTYNGRDNRVHSELIDFLAYTNGLDCFVDVIAGGTVTGGTWTSVDANSALEYNEGGTSITGGTRIRSTIVNTGAGKAGSLQQGRTDIRNPFVLSQVNNLAARQIEIAIVLTPFSGGGSTNTACTFNWNEQRI